MRPSVPNLYKRYPVPIARTVLYTILSAWLLAAVVVTLSLQSRDCGRSVYENKPLCSGSD